MIVLSLLKNNWKQIVIVLAVLSATYAAYDWSWQRGYDKANIRCQQILDKQEEERRAKIEELTAYAKSNLEQTVLNDIKTQKELADIKKAARNKPATVIIDGKCEPTKEFIEAYNAAITSGNKK